FLAACLNAYWTRQENKKNRELQVDLAKDQRKSTESLAEKQRQSNESLEHVKAALAEAAKDRERELRAKDVLDRCRRPLLDAAYDLGDRIDNHQHRGFGAYFADQHAKSGLAQLSTLYRVARFFGAYEILYTDFGFLHYPDDKKTKEVDKLLAQIAKT